MIKIRHLVIIASILAIIGLVGSLLTFRVSYPNEEVVQEMTIDSTFNEIEINTENVRVEILPTNDDNASVVLTGNIKKESAYNFSTEVKNQTLVIQADVLRKKIFQFFPKYLILELYVPTIMYDSLQIDNKNGRINLDGFQASNIHLETDNGTIRFNKVTTSSLIAKTSNGKIEGDHVETKTFEASTDNGTITANDLIADAIDVSTDNGKIIFNDVVGDIRGKTSNGSISMELEDLDRSVDLSTNNGRIEIKTTEKPTNATIASSTNNGKIEVYGNSSPHTVIGDGKHQIQLSTDNGSIKIYQ